MEYFFTNPKASEFMTSERAFLKHFRSSDFAGSDIYREVCWRCFDALVSIEPESAKTIARVLGGKEDSSDVNTLTRLGWWDPDSRTILSALLVNACLSSVQPETENAMYLQGSNWKANLEQLIIVGIFNIEPNDLIRTSAESSGWPVENALFYNWACKVRANFANVHLEFQSPRGTKLVDFYVNGVVGAGVKMLRDATQTLKPETKPQSQDIDEHADRFKPGGSYGDMERYALLNFSMDEKKDVVLPRDPIHHDRVYTFKLSNNSLYRGSTLIRCPAVSNLSSRTPHLGQNATYCTSARVTYLSVSDTNVFSASLEMLTLPDANTEAASATMLPQWSYNSYRMQDLAATLEQARTQAQVQSRWLLINIQTMESILRTFFLFWQRGHPSGDGAAYLRMHRMSRDDLSHLGIIDPRKLLALTGFIPPKDLMSTLLEFAGRNSLTIRSGVASGGASGVASGADSGYNSREGQEKASTPQAQGQAQQLAQHSLVMAAQSTGAPPPPLVPAVRYGPIPDKPTEDEEGVLKLRRNNTAAVAPTSMLSLHSTAAASSRLVRIPSTAHFAPHGSHYGRNLLLFRAAAPKMLLRALKLV